MKIRHTITGLLAVVALLLGGFGAVASAALDPGTPHQGPGGNCNVGAEKFDDSPRGTYSYNGVVFEITEHAVAVSGGSATLCIKGGPTNSGTIHLKNGGSATYPNFGISNVVVYTATPAPPVTEEFVTIIWKMDNWPHVDDIWPQTIVDHVVTDTPQLGAFDHLLTGNCVGYQVDVYRYTEKGDKEQVDYLISHGKLYSPGNPPEPLIYGGDGTAWKLYFDDDCDEKVTAVDPKVVQSPKCEVEGTLSVTPVEGVTYLLNGDTVEGTVEGPVDGTLTAEAQDGYKLTNPDFSYEVNIPAAEKCSVPPTTSTTTTTTPPVTTTTPPVTTVPDTTVPVPETTVPETTVVEVPVDRVVEVPVESDRAPYTCEELGWVDITVDDPLYHPDLDRDNDGIACEETGWNEAELAFTGPNEITALAIASGLLLLVLGLTILGLDKRRRRS